MNRIKMITLGNEKVVRNSKYNVEEKSMGYENLLNEKVTYGMKRPTKILKPNDFFRRKLEKIGTERT